VTGREASAETSFEAGTGLALDGATGGWEVPVGLGVADPVVRSARGARGKGALFWTALVWLGVVALAAVAAPWLPLPDPNELRISDKLLPPLSPGHLLGTDGLGRDILSRLAYGARVSLLISVSAVTIGMLVGGLLGMLVGFFRGRAETAVMALVDIILAFPGLVLLLALVAFVGQSLLAITLVVGFTSVPIYARVARANTLAVAQREFVLAARAMGARSRRILFREVLPNVILPVAAFGLVTLGVVIVLEGALAFLGLSVAPPDATWGSMIAEGKGYLTQTVNVALIPSVAMFFTVLSLNLVGDTLRSQFDVRESSI
jgi:peptide/nickel transport system permease protein